MAQESLGEYGMRYLIVGGTSIFGEPLVDILLKKDTTEEILATKLSGEKYYERKNLNWKLDRLYLQRS